MDEHAKPPPARKPRMTLRLALALSLGLNLLFVGAIAGAIYRNAGGPGARGPAMPGIEGYAAPYVHALPRPSRRALRQSLRAEAPMDRRARRALYQNMLAALRTVPFDQAAVAAVLETQTTVVEGVQDIARAAWLREITGMSAAERARYADKLETLLKRGPRRRKDRARP